MRQHACRSSNVGAAVTALVLLVAVARADELGMAAILLDAGGIAPNAAFGAAVATEGETVIVGAYGADQEGVTTGGVSVFESKNGLLQRTLNAPGGAAGDRFGCSVSVSQQRVLVGASADDDLGTDSGSAWLFDVVSGELLAKLLPPDGRPGQAFGSAVALVGSIAVVGAPGDGDLGVGAGAVYVFSTTSGRLLHELRATAGKAGDGFGASVALAGGRLVVGAPGVDDHGAESGAAYVFDATSGGQLMTLSGSDLSAGAGFGQSVSATVGRVLIGCPGDDAGKGAAYLFDLGTGELVEKLLAGDGLHGDRFGWSVGMSGEAIVVGARRSQLFGSYVGAAYLFHPTGLPKAKLMAGTGQNGDAFGAAVACSNCSVVVGAPRSGQGHTGSASLYDLSAMLAPLQLAPEDTAPSAGFGQAIAIHGAMAVIGAPQYDSFPPAGLGAAYLIDISTAEVWATLAPEPVTPGDLFGSAVALDEQLVFVGAPADSERGAMAGAAWVFDRVTGAPLYKLLADDGTAGDRFGTAVAVDGGVVAVGAPGVADQGAFSGAVYLFEVEAGRQLAKLLLAGGDVGDRFGNALAADDGMLLASAPGPAVGGPDVGSVTVLDSSTGAALFTLSPKDGMAGDAFGTAVDLDGGVAVVGAGHADVQGFLSGAAYLFELASGQQTAKLLAVESPGVDQAGDQFGVSVAISGGLVLVGAIGADGAGYASGAVYVFGTGSTDPVTKLFTGGENHWNQLGSSVALSGTCAVIGDVTSSSVAPSSGAAYLVDVSGFVWVDLCHGLAGADGVPLLSGAGDMGPGSGFSLQLEHAAPRAALGLVMGLGLAPTPMKGGLLVPTPDLLVSGFATDGSGNWSLDGTSPVELPVGLPVFLQAWLADPAGPQGFSASNALRVQRP